jgi:hypothetical protein
VREKLVACGWLSTVDRSSFTYLPHHARAVIRLLGAVSHAEQTAACGAVVAIHKLLRALGMAEVTGMKQLAADAEKHLNDWRPTVQAAVSMN